MSNPNNPLDLKKDSRRAAHTAAEKRRRDAINKGYEILNEAIIEVHNNYKRAKTEKLENEHWRSILRNFAIFQFCA